MCNSVANLFPALHRFRGKLGGLRCRKIGPFLAREV